MHDFDLSLLSILMTVLAVAIGITYTGVWVQLGGMKQTAIAMHTYLALSTMDLFMNPVSVNSSTVAGDLTPAAWTGYVQQVYTTTPVPVNDLSAGGYAIYLPSDVFVCTVAPGSPVTVYGCMLLDAAGALIAACNFASPLVIQSIGDSVPLQVTLNFSNAGLKMFAAVLS